MKVKLCWSTLCSIIDCYSMHFFFPVIVRMMMMMVACGLRGPRDSYPMQFLLPYFSTYFSILSHTSIFLPGHPRSHTYFCSFLQSKLWTKAGAVDEDCCATFGDFGNNVDVNTLAHFHIFPQSTLSDFPSLCSFILPSTQSMWMVCRWCWYWWHIDYTVDGNDVFFYIYVLHDLKVIKNWRKDYYDQRDNWWLR